MTPKITTSVDPTSFPIWLDTKPHIELLTSCNLISSTLISWIPLSLSRYNFFLLRSENIIRRINPGVGVVGPSPTTPDPSILIPRFWWWVERAVDLLSMFVLPASRLKLNLDFSKLMGLCFSSGSFLRALYLVGVKMLVKKPVMLHL